MDNIQKNFPKIKPLNSNTFYQYIDEMEDKMDILINIIDYAVFFDHEEDLELYNYKGLKTILKEWYGEIDFKTLYNFYGYNDFLQEYIEFLGYKTGIVGHSQWSYYITVEDEDYVKDLYEGCNFYDIAILNESGEVIGSLCWIYAPDEFNLQCGISCNFDINMEDIVLVDNNTSEFFNLPKVKKVVDSYKFINVN